MVIPDGDRRYAQQAGIPFREAYLQAARTLRLLAEWLMAEHKVDEFTFFGLSLANVAGRDAGNLRAILEVQTRALREFSVDPFFRREGIRIRVCGELERLPAGYREAARRAEEATREGTRNFNLLLGYSGRSDLLQALRRTIREKPAYTFDDIRARCQVKSPVDFLIRTAGVQRISDGPLFLMEYTEFKFLPALFPELTQDEVSRALAEYAQRQRTFGV